MNYKKIYNQLIQKGKEQSVEGYTEQHHIVPRCMGGTDDPLNLVALTPEQHYTAHLLLAKIFPDNSGLWYACQIMSSGLVGRNNKSYGWVRKRVSKLMATSVKNRWAVKAGFNDHIDQCQTYWNDLLGGMRVTEISERYGVVVSRIQRCLKEWAETTDQSQQLSELRRSRKSEVSRQARLNENSEQHAARMAKVNDSISSETRSKCKRGSLNPSSKPVTINGESFGTIREASGSLGLAYHVVRNRIKSKSYPEWRYA